MAKINFWQGKPFNYTYENCLKNQIKPEFYKAFKDSKSIEDINLCFSFYLDNTEYDFAFFSKNIIFILDFKNYNLENIDGYANGNWFSKLPIGGKKEINSDKNPFQQCSVQRSKMTKLLLENSNYDKTILSKYTYSGILFNNKIDIGLNINKIIHENIWFLIHFLPDLEILIKDIENKSKKALDINIERILTSNGFKREYEEVLAEPIRGSIEEKREKELQHIVMQPKEKDLIIKAGAGTGKTYFLIERVLELMNRGVSLEECNLITFTRKAAKDIEDKLLKEAYKKIDYHSLGKILPIGTIHSFCYKLIGNDWDYFGYKKKPIIINEARSKSIINNISASHGWPDKQDFYKLFSYILNISGENIIDGLKENIQFNKTNIDYEKYNQIIKKYHSYLVSRNLICYNFMQLFAYKYIKSDSYKQKNILKYLFIDEFQDITKLELDIFKTLHNIHRVIICLIGDPKQAIYGFRGGLFKAFNSIMEIFPNIGVFGRSYNSRSSKKIIDFLNKYLKKNYPDVNDSDLLKPYIKKEGKVGFYSFKNDKDEAEFILLKILDALNKDDIRPNEIAILTRKEVDYFADKIIKLLNKEGIDIASTPTYLFEEEFVQRLLIFLEAVSSNIPDDELLRNVYEMNPISSRNNSLELFSRKKFGNWNDFLDYTKSILNNTSNNINYDIKWFYNIILEVQRYINSKDVALSSLIILFKEKIHKPFMNLQESNNIEHIDMIYEKLFNCIENLNGDNLESQEIISEFSEEINGIMFGDANQNGIRIDTIHSSKGLEYKVVFIIAPYEDERDDTFDNEEKNIIYVGLTRAIEELNITFAKKKNLKEYHVSELFKDFI